MSTSSVHIHKRSTRERSWIERAIILFFHFHPHFADQQLNVTSGVFDIKAKTIYHWFHYKEVINKWKDIVLGLTVQMVLEALPKRKDREMYATRFTAAELVQSIPAACLPSAPILSDAKKILAPVGATSSHQKQRALAQASKDEYVYLKKQQKRVHTTKHRVTKFAVEERWLIEQILNAKERRTFYTMNELRNMVRHQFTQGKLYECHIRDLESGAKDSKGLNQWLRRTLQQVNYTPKKQPSIL
ncbi:hypothetical protein FisN_25Lh154 [Fistulifera solaris]|uniref:Uncharacterized protein n=1 Tax=Fistulifera solaris TaxID=1519565 RepID=A0A1Z5KR85_FISSO|nr:hypothetical protein FisN_25Lh154 [Fistulifera solaris]|eukprot:GAX28789.1 hypothetical protein FisN_25Lh154 [Fistulifera solaris]